MNTLYFGNNLLVLREQIADGSIDLIYLDPPFNSQRGYNLLFKSPEGRQSDAQITAFEDTWRWGPQAEREYTDILRQPNTDVAQVWGDSCPLHLSSRLPPWPLVADR